MLPRVKEEMLAFKVYFLIIVLVCSVRCFVPGLLGNKWSKSPKS